MLIIVLAGCSKKGTDKDAVPDDGSDRTIIAADHADSTPDPNVIVKSSAVEVVYEEPQPECIRNSDCNSGYFCFEEECQEDKVLQTMQACTQALCSGLTCEYDVCEKLCPTCVEDTRICMKTLEGYPDGLCVECYSDEHCKEGYSCQSFKCLPELAS